MVNMTLHQPNDIIAQRYRIVTPLGEGGMGITYEAEDLTNYQRVAVKAVSLRQAKDWKILELFEREAKVLATLHHPGIPKYLDYFHLDTEEDRHFYLIRELVSGDSLAAWVARGWHPTEVEIKQIAIKILEILSYLHQLNPSIIHRDIKPQNIIRQADGEIFLVDFGAVQDIYHNTISFSGTFVGTVGYMPPEQLRGKAYCASDLYSLGGTLLYLLTHRSPDELPQKRMNINFRSCVRISSEFAHWLEIMLEPMFEDRFQSATQAFNALQNNSEIIDYADSIVQSVHKKPTGSRVKIKKTSRSLTIDIPPLGFQAKDLDLWIFALTWNVIMSVSFLRWITLLPDLVVNPSNLLIGVPVVSIFAIFLVSIGFYFIAYLFWIYVGKTHIQIYKNEFLIRCKCFIFSHKIRGKTADLGRITVNYMGIKKGRKASTNVALFEGVKKHEFGFKLSLREKEWLVGEISDFLRQLKSR
jgi:serine/threonine protein kinase